MCCEISAAAVASGRVMQAQPFAYENITTRKAATNIKFCVIMFIKEE
jgi:hypothetical protein